ncbi:MAG: hypothetical protein IT438_12955 [Phycisphaerales bacterium]|nr:hypothetical protein [Phycisphaerales bacterium]
MESLVYWGVGLLSLAALLLIIEVFVPTAGVLGVTSACVAIGGVVCLFRYDWRWGMSGLLAIAIIGPTIVFVGLQIFPSTAMGKKMLNLPPDALDGGAPAPSPGAEFEALIGEEGLTLTDLRPGGFIRIGDKRVAAMSEIAFVRSGTRVRVTGSDAMQVRVRPADDSAHA